MFVLTPQSAPQYLAERRWLGAGPFEVSELAGGVSNTVLRVECPAGRFVLKQACAQLRTQQEWFSDLSRIFREVRVMLYLREQIPELADAIPAVLHQDRANYAFLMSHAPIEAVDWRSVMLGGSVEPSLGELAGRILGLIHACTQDCPEFADRVIFEQLRVEPFYEQIQRKYPALADPIDGLLQRMRYEQRGMCLGDFSPKNLLLAKGQFTLVDFETAHWGDVTMDLGFFLSHLLIKAVHLDEPACLRTTERFWQGYETVVGGKVVAERWAAAIGHLGVCLLARVDGKSPVPYLRDEAKRERVRQLGYGLLSRPAQTWSEVTARVMLA